MSVREVFLNDEHDAQYASYVYDEYVSMIAECEKALVDLKLKRDNAEKTEKAALDKQVKEAEASISAMKIAMNDMKRFISSFVAGMQA